MPVTRGADLGERRTNSRWLYGKRGLDEDDVHGSYPRMNLVVRLQHPRRAHVRAPGAPTR